MDRHAIVIFGGRGRTGDNATLLARTHPSLEIVANTTTNPEEKGYDLFRFGPEDFESLKKKRPELGLFCYGDKEAEERVPLIRKMLPEMRLIDLSSAWRTRREQIAERNAYGAPELPGYRQTIAQADFVTNPGCYALIAELGFMPAVVNSELSKFISKIIVYGSESKTGAGSKAEKDGWYDDEGFYKTIGHRHIVEMKQVLHGHGVHAPLGFRPEVQPLFPGQGMTVELIFESGCELNQEMVERIWSEHYANEPFIEVLRYADLDPAKELSQREVRGTNMCKMFAVFDEETGDVVVRAVADNLMKGASGNAVQCANVMFDMPETTGLQNVRIRYGLDPNNPRAILPVAIEKVS